jgi:peptidoglycan-N-acetylglucosamine deacetylase
MLNFRTASIYMVILAVAGILLMITDIRYGWLLAALAAVYIYLLVMGSLKICSGFYMDVSCRGGSEEKVIALTFDDGPDINHTPHILEILEKHQVRATFFVIGSKAEKQENILRQIVSQGHSIGNHSYSHAFFFDLFGRKKMEQDLQKADELIMKVTGKKPVLFRPPYGVTNPVLARVVKKLGYRAIGWSVRSLDTVLKDEGKVIERIKDRLHPGAVILMHDDREVTVRVIEKIIFMVKEEGYRFVGIEELMLKMEG